MVQWVKNLTAVARVTAEVQVQPSAWCSGLKDPACHSCGSDSVTGLGTYICCGHKEKKGGNNSICSNMDGPRDYHTK